MDTGFWIGILALAVVASWIVGSTLRRKKDASAFEIQRQALIQSQADLEAHRQMLYKAQSDAARLPDATSRSERAELAYNQQLASSQDALAREAALDATLVAVRARVTEYDRIVKDLEERCTASGSSLAAAQRDAASANAGLAASRDQASQFAAERDKHAADLTGMRAQFAELSAIEAKMRAERDAAISSHQQAKTFLEDAQTTMKTAFIEAASKVFDDKSISLEQRIKESGDASRQGLEATIKPFSEQVGQFQAKIETFASDHARDFAKFEGSVNTIQKLNQEMADATNSLARALTGNAKARGDWGEMILDTVLKASGLVEGTNYISQAATTDEESGKRRSPDVIVNLPDGRQIVVDAKVNLIAWTEASNAETSSEYEDAMLRHTAAMRIHVRDLVEKNYPRTVGAQALDLTIMFVPIEGALSAALSTNTDLQTEALNKRVVFASPNTLMAMLRVVERLWTRDRLQRQVDTIGTEAGKVLDALIDFMADFEDIQKNIGRADLAFRAAKNRLHDSDRSVINRTRRLVEAGAKGRKAIPEALQAIGQTASVLPLDFEDNGEAAGLEK